MKATVAALVLLMWTAPAVAGGCGNAFADIDGDGNVGVGDVQALLAAWGVCPPKEACPADVNVDYVVDVLDLIDVLQGWGPVQGCEIVDIVDRNGLEAMVAGDPTVHYRLMVDLDLAGEPWVAIGTPGDEFRGTFDGNGHTIRNLHTAFGLLNYRGLFGRTTGATIRNVTLEDVNVSGNDYVGGLVGDFRGNTIENVHVTGTVVGHHYVGAVIGYSTNSLITGASSQATVTGAQYAGGINGYVIGSTLVDVAAEGTITSVGGIYTGGISGYALGGTFDGCVFDGQVTGVQGVGGIVGYLDFGSATNLSAAGTFTGEDRVGGLFGYMNFSTATDGVATGGVFGAKYLGGIAGYTKHALIQETAWDGNVDSQGYAGGIGGYVVEESTVLDSTAAGTVTSWDQYAGGLVGFANTTMIARSSATMTIVGETEVGGAVGMLLGGSELWDAHADGTVTGRVRVGGFVGHVTEGSHVRDASTRSTVSGVEGVPTLQLGGFAGAADDAAFIERSYATGDVHRCGFRAGGFVGYLEAATILNAYARGSVHVTNPEQVTYGGFLGATPLGGSADAGSIVNVYATGRVIHDDDPDGVYGAGFAGVVDPAYLSLTGAYWDIETSQQTTACTGGGCGTVIGLPTVLMMQPTSFAGWTFENDEVDGPWCIDAGNGYPYLCGQD